MFACLSWWRPPKDLLWRRQQQQGSDQGIISGIWTKFKNEQKRRTPVPKWSNLLWYRTPPSSRSWEGQTCLLHFHFHDYLVRVVRHVRQELVGNEMVGGGVEVGGEVHHLPLTKNILISLRFVVGLFKREIQVLTCTEALARGRIWRKRRKNVKAICPWCWSLLVCFFKWALTFDLDNCNVDKSRKTLMWKWCVCTVACCSKPVYVVLCVIEPGCICFKLKSSQSVTNINSMKLRWLEYKTESAEDSIVLKSEVSLRRRRFANYFWNQIGF